MATELEQNVIDAARAGIGVGRPGVDWFNHQEDRKRLVEALAALDRFIERSSRCGICGGGHPADMHAGEDYG